MYNSIVLGGGSATGLVTLGSLQYLYDNFMMNDLKKYIGTSSGAITCFLLLIGYTPIEIIVYICKERLMESMHSMNLVSMLNGTGAMSFNSIYSALEKMTINKIGYLPTFRDIETRYNKILIITTFNLSKMQPEYLSFETTPDLPILIALKMSSNLPFVFENFKYNKNYYIDGGISNNFPIDLLDDDDKALAIRLSNDDNDDNNDNDDDKRITYDLNEKTFLEYVYTVIFVPIMQQDKNKIKNCKKSNKIISIKVDKSSFNFNIIHTDKLDMFSSGYSQTRSIIETVVEPIVEPDVEPDVEPV